MQTDAIRRVSIRAETPGVPEATAQLGRLAGAQRDVAAAADTQARATAALDQAMQRQQVQLDIMRRQMQQLAAANDNMARSMAAANDNAEVVGRRFVVTAGDVMSLVGPLKVAAVAAYALSPAFRTFVNPAIAGAVSATGTALAAMGPAAAAVATSIGSRLLPGLALVSRIALPIMAAVEAVKLLNYTIGLGAGLLEKYGNEQRNLIGGVDANLAKLTRFQDEGLSAQQVQFATELGQRLAIAKQTISEFAKVQFDLTDPALKLQAIWVRIVEIIASATDKLSALIEKIPFREIPSALFSAPVLGPVITGLSGVAGMAGPSPEAPSRADALTAAYQRLAAGMGSTTNFAVRFGQAINDLQNPQQQQKKATDEAVSAFDREIERLHRREAVMKADAQATGLGAGAREAFRTQQLLDEAASRDEIGLTTERIKKINEEVEASRKRADERARAQVATEIDFQKQTMLLGPHDVQIAQQLRQIYGNDIPAALASAEAAQLRFIAGIKELKDAATSFATTFIQGLMQGKSAIQALQPAVNQLATSLLNSALQNPTQGGTLGWLPAIAAVVGATLFNRSQQQQQQQQQQQRSNFNTTLDLQLRRASAGADTGTLQGALTQFEANAIRERVKAIQDGSTHMVELEQTLSMERQVIIEDFGRKAAEQERLNQEAILQRQKSFLDREFSAGTDTSTLAGAMAAFERKASQERLDEQTAGGQAAAELERALSAEKLQIETDFAKRDADIRAAAAKAALQRAQSLEDRLFAATVDTSTLQGAQIAQERDFAKQIADERAAGAENMLLLEVTQQAERLKLQADFNDKAVAAEKQAAQDRQNAINQAAKNIVDYLNGLLSGPASTLAPSAVLANAQAAYNANLTLAQAGNIDAQNKFTQLADNLEKAARAFYGSSTSYQTIRSQIIAQGIALPAVVATDDPVVIALRDLIAPKLTDIKSNTGTGGTIDLALGPGGTIGANTAPISTVVTNTNGITTIATNTGNLSSIALHTGGIDTLITKTGDNLASMAVNLGGAGAVGGGISSIATNTGSISTVATNTAGITTVATNTAGITTVATNTAGITTVASNTGPISSLVTNTGGISTLVTNIGGTGGQTLFTVIDTKTGQVISNTADTAANIGSNDSQGIRQIIKALDLANQSGGFQSRALNKIVTLSAQGFTASQGFWATGTTDIGFARGGWVTGGMPGRDSVRALLMPGEHVTNTASARSNASLLNLINRTPGPVSVANDNGASLAELRALRAEVQRLTRMVEAGAEHQREGSDGVRDAVKGLARAVEFNKRVA